MAATIYQMEEKYEEYLIDESKYKGHADSISFPESEDEILAILEEMKEEQIPVTIQGAKTGITGAGVPMGGHILNLSHMNQVIEHSIEADGTGRITVEPGINLIELRKEITARFRKEQLFWPPDPTETSASIGGIVASGAQGISHMLYGETENYIESIRRVDGSGNVRDISRGQKEEILPGETMDALNMVLGKEGITGIITRITLKVIPKPEAIWGIVFFFEEKEGAAGFVDMLRSELPEAEDAKIAAVEYMDRRSMDLIEARKETMTKIKELPDIEENIQALVYTELQGSEEGIEIIAESLMEAAMECGSDPDQAWALSGETEVEKLHAFRHAAAETANLYIEEQRRNDDRITKLGTDMVIGEQTFKDLLEQYEEDMNQAGLEGCIFGHALENHLHVNILPEDYEAYEKGIELIRNWAERTRALHGVLSGEHGVGKLKRQILGACVPEDYQELCRKLKAHLDIEGRLNQGNILG